MRCSTHVVCRGRCKWIRNLAILVDQGGLTLPNTRAIQDFMGGTLIIECSLQAFLCPGLFGGSFAFWFVRVERLKALVLSEPHRFHGRCDQETLRPPAKMNMEVTHSCLNMRLDMLGYAFIISLIRSDVQTQTVVCDASGPRPRPSTPLRTRPPSEPVLAALLSPFSLLSTVLSFLLAFSRSSLLLLTLLAWLFLLEKQEPPLPVARKTTSFQPFRSFRSFFSLRRLGSASSGLRTAAWASSVVPLKRCAGQLPF